MSDKLIRPGLTAAMTAGRALLAAGWRYDSTSPMANDTTIRTLLHPTGREIHARTVDGGEQTDLTMTGLTLKQVAGAVAGAGLGIPAGQPETVTPGDRLHTTAASIAAALRRAADDLAKLGHVELSPVAVQINLQAVSYRGTSAQRTGTVDRLGMALIGHPGTSGDGPAGHHSVPLDHRDRGDIEVAIYTAVKDFGSRS